MKSNSTLHVRDIAIEIPAESENAQGGVFSIETRQIIVDDRLNDLLLNESVKDLILRIGNKIFRLSAS